MIEGRRNLGTPGRGPPSQCCTYSRGPQIPTVTNTERSGETLSSSKATDSRSHHSRGMSRNPDHQSDFPTDPTAHVAEATLPVICNCLAREFVHLWYTGLIPEPGIHHRASHQSKWSVTNVIGTEVPREPSFGNHSQTYRFLNYDNVL